MPTPITTITQNGIPSSLLNPKLRDFTVLSPVVNQNAVARRDARFDLEDPNITPELWNKINTVIPVLGRFKDDAKGLKVGDNANDMIARYGNFIPEEYIPDLISDIQKDNVTYSQIFGGYPKLLGLEPVERPKITQQYLMDLQKAEQEEARANTPTWKKITGIGTDRGLFGMKKLTTKGSIVDAGSLVDQVLRDENYLGNLGRASAKAVQSSVDMAFWAINNITDPAGVIEWMGNVGQTSLEGVLDMAINKANRLGLVDAQVIKDELGGLKNYNELKDGLTESIENATRGDFGYGLATAMAEDPLLLASATSVIGGAGSRGIANLLGRVGNIQKGKKILGAMKKAGAFEEGGIAFGADAKAIEQFVLRATMLDNAGGNLNKLQRVSQGFYEIGGTLYKADPYYQIFKGGFEGLKYITKPIRNLGKTPDIIEGIIGSTVEERVAEVIDGVVTGTTVPEAGTVGGITRRTAGLTKGELTAVTSNEFMPVVWETIKDVVATEGIGTSTIDVINKLVDQQVDNVVDLMRKMQNEIDGMGKAYNPARSIPQDMLTIQTAPMIDRMREIIAKSNLGIENGKIIKTQFSELNNGDIKRLQEVYNDIVKFSETSVDGGFRLRYNITSQIDWTEVGKLNGNKVLKEIRFAVKEEMHQQAKLRGVNFLELIDETYAPVRQAIEKIEKYVEYTSGQNRGEIRKSIGNTVRNINRRGYEEIKKSFEMLDPDISEKVRAINDSRVLLREYKKIGDPKQEAVTGAWGAVASIMFGGKANPIKIIGSGLGAFFGSVFMGRVKLGALDKVVSSISGEGFQKWFEISEKIEKGTVLSQADIDFMNEIGNMLKKWTGEFHDTRPVREFANTVMGRVSKDVTKQYMPMYAMEVTPEGIVKLRGKAIAPETRLGELRKVEEIYPEEMRQNDWNARYGITKPLTPEELEEIIPHIEAVNKAMLEVDSVLKSGDAIKEAVKNITSDNIIATQDKIIGLKSDIAKVEEAKSELAKTVGIKIAEDMIPRDTIEFLERELKDMNDTIYSKSNIKKIEASSKELQARFDQNRLKSYDRLEPVEQEYLDLIETGDIEKNKLFSEFEAERKAFFDRVEQDSIPDKRTPIEGLRFRRENPNATVADGVRLTPEEAQATVYTYFEPNEVTVLFRDRITTPEGYEALGAYMDGAIELVKNPTEHTITHEAVHGYIDMFMSNKEKREMLEYAKKRYQKEINQYAKDNGYKIDDVATEERVAESFNDFVQQRKTFVGRVRQFFEALRNRIKRVFGKEDKIKQLYRDLAEKRRPATPVRERPVSMERYFNSTDVAVQNQLTNHLLDTISSEIKKDTITRGFLENFKGRQGVSKVDKALIDGILDSMVENSISKADFEGAIRGQFLELGETRSSRYADYNGLRDREQYGADNLYTRIYEAPFETKGTWNHFGKDDYFAHARVEEIGDINRVVEIQSDLFQQKRYESLKLEQLVKTGIADELSKLRDEKRVLSDPYHKVYRNISRSFYLEIDEYNLKMNEFSKSIEQLPDGELKEALREYYKRLQEDGITSSYGQFITDEKNKIQRMVSEEINEIEKLDPEVEKNARNKVYAMSERELVANYDEKAVSNQKDFSKRQGILNAVDLIESNFNEYKKYTELLKRDKRPIEEILKDDKLQTLAIATEMKPRDIIDWAQVSGNGTDLIKLDAVTRKKTNVMEAMESLNPERFIDDRTAMLMERQRHLNAYANNWYERIVREEIQKGAQDGKTAIQLPDHKTVAYIEKYITGGEGIGYGHHEGDIVELGGDDYLIISKGYNEYEAVNVNDVKHTNSLRNWKDSEIDYYVEDLIHSEDGIKDLQNDIYMDYFITDVEANRYATYKGLKRTDDHYVDLEDLRERFATENGIEYLQNSDRFREFIEERYIEDVYGDNAKAAAEELTAQHGVSVYADNNDYLYFFDRDPEIRHFTMGAGVSDGEGWIDNIGEDNKAVVNFYKQRVLPYAEKYAKSLGKDPIRVEQDGGRWLEIPVDETDANMAIKARRDPNALLAEEMNKTQTFKEFINNEGYLRDNFELDNIFVDDKGREVFTYSFKGDKTQGQLTYTKTNNGFTVNNIFLPESEQGKGLGTNLYRELNGKSLKSTGQPLFSDSRTLANGQVVTERSDASEALRQSLVRKGYATEIEGGYRFKNSDELIQTRAEVTPDRRFREGPQRYNDSTEYVARERFDFNQIQKLSFGGSDRDVYKLPDGNVLKVAKTARGLGQNQFAERFLSETVLPKIIEKGENYTVFEPVTTYADMTDGERALVRDFITKIEAIGNPTTMFGITNREKIDKIMELFEEIGRGNLNNYDLSLFGYGDLKSRNLGIKDGQIVLLDEGTIDLVRTMEQYKDVKNLDDVEFRDFYTRSKKAKDLYGDLDPKTMYSIAGVIIPGSLLIALLGVGLSA